MSRRTFVQISGGVAAVAALGVGCITRKGVFDLTEETGPGAVGGGDGNATRHRQDVGGMWQPTGWIAAPSGEAQLRVTDTHVEMRTPLDSPVRMSHREFIEGRDHQLIRQVFGDSILQEARETIDLLGTVRG